MEIEEVNTSFEQRVCYLFATNDTFIEEVADKWQRGLLNSKYCEKLASLCVKYFNKYGTAPKDNLAKFVGSAVSLKKLDADTAAEIQTIIHGFGSEDAVTDIDFEVGEVLKYFEKQAIKLVSEEAQVLADKGDVTGARELLTNIDNFQRTKLDGCDIYSLDDT